MKRGENEEVPSLISGIGLFIVKVVQSEDRPID